MKVIIFLFLVFICCTVVFLILSLIYPVPTAPVGYDGAEVNEAYFFSKILSNHIDESKENKLVVTEEELNRYISYRLKQQSYKLQTIEIDHGEVKLLDQMTIFIAYGRYGSLPVRMEAHLIPSIQEDSIVFEIEKIKLSRLSIPKVLIDKLYTNSLYTLPLAELGFIKIESLIVLDGEAIIGYSVDRQKIFEEIIKGLSKQSN